MERSRSFAASRTTLVAAIVGMALLPFAGIAPAQAARARSYKVKLASRTFTPAPGIERLLRDSLAVQVDRGERRHVFVQLTDHLDRMERSQLDSAGVKLLNYLGGYTWYATVRSRKALDFSLPRVVSEKPILGRIRWVGEIRPNDRFHPDVLNPAKYSFIRAEGNREKYSVKFFNDVLTDAARSVIRRLGGTIDEETKLINRFSVVLPRGAADSLKLLDEVELIDLYPPPPGDDNDGSRAWCHTDAVHAAGIEGDGIALGQWESGVPRDAHVDLTAVRVHHGEVGTIKEHATHVCGTIMGTGTGDPLYLGHGPGVSDIYNYTYTGAPDEMADEFGNHDILAANNSWSPTLGWDDGGAAFEDNQDRFGDYRDDCPAYDALVHDSGLVIVFSSGNDRNDAGVGHPSDADQVDGAGSWDGYHTAKSYGTAKDVITVGAINDATGAMSTFSNWGPADDGRIKPDVVAPGVSMTSCNYADADGNLIYDDYLDNYSGTSMAAPAVTGIVALLTRSYREEYLGSTATTATMLPSTVKAILCHSAQDMGDPGPDYQFGYGGVRADAARQVIIDRRFREGAIASMDDRDEYEFTVPAGAAEVRVTLAWDDAPAAAGNPNPTIVNDLDVVIQDPNGIFYTPWHLYITAHDQAMVQPAHTSHNVASTDLIPEADRDRWNNVEQVLVDPAFYGGPLPAGTWRAFVEPQALPEAPQRYSLASSHLLQGEVEVVQVLDRSGSMLMPAALGSADRKLDALMQAANTVVDLVEPEAGHKMGLVKYREDVVPFASDVNLNHEVTPGYVTTLHTMIDAIDDDVQPWHCTSIGDGLTEGLNQFAAHGNVDNCQVMLLMTDGLGNSHLGVNEVWDDPAGPWASRTCAIYTLGLGYDGSICSDTLAWLAERTGGDFRQTNDPLELQKFFIEALASAVDWSAVTDPTETIGPGSEKSFPVVVTTYDQDATFSAYWAEVNNAIELTVLRPDGSAVTTSGPGVRFVGGKRYAICQVQRTAGNWAGEWRIKVRSTAKRNVTFSTTSLTNSSLRLDAGYDKLQMQTGDRARVWARISADPDLPSGGPKVVAYCNRPLKGVGNVLHEMTVDPAKLRVMDTTGERSLTVLKLDYLQSLHKGQLLPRADSTLVLYDDGGHADGAAGDGLYANTFEDTKTAGSYTFRFVASDIPTGAGLKTTREWTKSFYTQVGIAPDYSQLAAKFQGSSAKGLRYRVSVTPRDRFGNYLGPGHQVTVSASRGAAVKPVMLDDKLDGTYAREVVISHEDYTAGARLELSIGGKSFSTIERLPAPRRGCLGLF